jgi:hypothetical protein
LASSPGSRPGIWRPASLAGALRGGIETIEAFNEGIAVLAVRWQIATFFEYAKDLLGSDDYQLMTALAVQGCWTLIACMMCFLEELRAADPDLSLTCGDVRHAVQYQHRLNLLHWLEDRFKEGCPRFLDL